MKNRSFFQFRKIFYSINMQLHKNYVYTYICGEVIGHFLLDEFRSASLRAHGCQLTVERTTFCSVCPLIVSDHLFALRD